MFFATVLACTISPPIDCKFYLDYFHPTRQECQTELRLNGTRAVEPVLPEGYFIVDTECFTFGTLL